MDELDDRGIVGPSTGTELRDILLDLDAGQPDTTGSVVFERITHIYVTF